jgi:hypothetical protein
MRYLKVFSVLLVLGFFVSTVAQAYEQNFKIPFDKSEFSQILNEKFNSKELSIEYTLSQYPDFAENRQELIDNLWEEMSETRNDLLSKKYKDGGVYLYNGTNDYEISFRFDGYSTDKIRVNVNSPE